MALTEEQKRRIREKAEAEVARERNRNEKVTPKPEPVSSVPQMAQSTPTQAEIEEYQEFLRYKEMKQQQAQPVQPVQYVVYQQSPAQQQAPVNEPTKQTKSVRTMGTNKDGLNLKQQIIGWCLFFVLALVIYIVTGHGQNLLNLLGIKNEQPQDTQQTSVQTTQTIDQNVLGTNRDDDIALVGENEGSLSPQLQESATVVNYKFPVVEGKGNTSLSDENYIKDMSNGLVERWKIALGKTNSEITLLSEKQRYEYTRNCLDAECAFIAKYENYKFADEKLQRYAQIYLYGLKYQYMALTDYLGKDETKYEEYNSLGYKLRSKAIYLINKSYGLDIPSKYSDTLLSMVSNGQIAVCESTIEDFMKGQFVTKDLDFETKSNSITIKPFNIYNNTSISLNNFSLQMHFVKDGIQISEKYLVVSEDLKANESISSRSLSVYDEFDSFYYTYSCYVYINGYSEQFEGRVNTDSQYSWQNGQLKKGGELAKGQPDYDIEKMSVGWEFHNDIGQRILQPTVRFDIKNIGTGSANSIVVKCVFKENANNKVWSENSRYVVSSSDMPLEPGVAKGVIITSSIGYTKLPMALPELTAEIYINDRFIATIPIPSTY